MSELGLSNEKKSLSFSGILLKIESSASVNHCDEKTRKNYDKKGSIGLGISPEIYSTIKCSYTGPLLSFGFFVNQTATTTTIISWKTIRNYLYKRIT